MWKPVFNINTAIARALMYIEATKAVIENTTLSPVIEAQLRNQARIASGQRIIPPALKEIN